MISIVRTLSSVRFFAVTALIILFVSGCAVTPDSTATSAETERGVEQSQGGVEQSQKRQEQILQLDSKVTHGSLQNGLEYYVRRNDKPQDRLQLRLVVDAGSVQENDEQRGLAHFVEHMAFNGTEKYAKHAIVDYLEQTGMRFGPDINAYTSFDETVYKLDLPTDDPEMIRKGVDILKEWAFRIAFDPEEVEKEKGVVVEEWRQGRGAQARMRDEYWPVLMRGAPRYAERLPIGSMETVRSTGPEELRRFYTTWYRPDNMAIVAVGDTDPQSIVSLIERYFAPVEQPETELPSTPETTEPQPEQRRFVVTTDPETQNTAVRLIGFHDAFTLETVDEYRTYLARRLYREMVEERLSEKTEQREPPFVYGYFSLTSFIRPAESSVWGALAKEGEVETALRTLVWESQRVEQHGFLASELERAKDAVRSSMKHAYEEREKTESVRFAEEYVRNFLSGEAAPGIAREWELTQELLPKIGMEDISRVHDQYASRSGTETVLVTGPEKEDIDYPDRKQLRSILTDVLEEEIEPYEEKQLGKELMSWQPQPGEIVSEGSEEAGDYHYFTFDNGAKIYYKQTDFKNDEVLFSAMSPGGASLVPTEEYHAALMAPSFVAASGLGEHTPSEIRKILSGKQVKVRPYVQELHEGFRGSARPQDLQYLFQQLYLYFTAVREDENLFTSYRQRVANVLQNRRNRPEVQLSDLVTSLLFEDHPRRAPLTAEKVRKIEAEQAYRLFRERFSGAGDFTFFFVGNIAPERLKGMAARYIGSLRSGQEEEWIERNVRYTERSAEKRITAGMASKSSVRLLYSGLYQWSLSENSLLSSLQQLLEIRLREEVREEAGGTYGVSVSASPSRYPTQEYVLRIAFSCDPGRVEELIHIIEKEIQRIAEEGVAKENVEKVRSIRRTDLEESRETNEFWRGFLESKVRHDLDPETLLDKEERIEAVGSEKLQRAVERYLLNGTRIEAVLMPEDGEQKNKEEQEGGE